MTVDTERPVWKVYEVRDTDMYGYHTIRYAVREEYADGATRHIHNERVDTPEEAQLLASKFNLYARKGRRYDNVMKTWE